MMKYAIIEQTREQESVFTSFDISAPDQEKRIFRKACDELWRLCHRLKGRHTGSCSFVSGTPETGYKGFYLAIKGSY